VTAPAVGLADPTAPPSAIFVDTTVLVAAAVRAHTHYERSAALLASIPVGTGFCAAHSLAEMYATLTALPMTPRIHPSDAATAVRHRARTLHSVVLTPEEHLQAILAAAERGAVTGQVYDALILAAAAKSPASVIYTWNMRHFQRLASPSVSSKLRTP
jgi:predicted nucleic acid-binding protein